MVTDDCLETTVEYLDTTRTDAVWTTVPKNLSNGVFKIDDGRTFSIQLNDERLSTYEAIIGANNGKGGFRNLLSCRQEGTTGRRSLNGCLMFEVTLGSNEAADDP